MKNLYIYILQFVLLIFISLNTKAQLNLNPKAKLPKVVSKSFYIKQYLKNTPVLINDSIKIIWSHELHSGYQLPLDNMICAVPNREIKNHIKVFNPEAAATYSTDNIPNALPRVVLIK